MKCSAAYGTTLMTLAPFPLQKTMTLPHEPCVYLAVLITSSCISNPSQSQHEKLTCKSQEAPLSCGWSVAIVLHQRIEMLHTVSACTKKSISQKLFWRTMCTKSIAMNPFAGGNSSSLWSYLGKRIANSCVHRNLLWQCCNTCIFVPNEKLPICYVWAADRSWRKESRRTISDSICKKITPCPLLVSAKHDKNRTPPFHALAHLLGCKILIH